MIETRTSLPTIFVRVVVEFFHGGRLLRPGEQLWLTETDALAHHCHITRIRTLPRRAIEERIAECNHVLRRI